MIIFGSLFMNISMFYDDIFKGLRRFFKKIVRKFQPNNSKFELSKTIFAKY
jgi:hypothetical protein